LDLRDAAYQDELFFVQITVPKSIDKNGHPERGNQREAQEIDPDRWDSLPHSMRTRGESC
jgi:hypothetical protein